MSDLVTGAFLTFQDIPDSTWHIVDTQQHLLNK